MLVVRRRAGWLLLLTAIAFTFVLASAGSARADEVYRFFQFNMCGAKNTAECPNNGSTTAPVVTATRNSIEDHKPAGASLNEVCYSQYTKLLNDLNARGIWKMDGRFITTNPTPTSCNPDAFGNAVLSRKPILASSAYSLDPVENGVTRKMICVFADYPVDTRVCSVHITTNNNYKDGQIQEVTGVVNDWVVNYNGPVVLMGDFNVSPGDSRLNRLYDSSHPNGFGKFQEVDEGSPPCRCGESTLGSLKYDYIFVSAKHWHSVDGDATFSDYSDHDPLRGSAWQIFP